MTKKQYYRLCLVLALPLLLMGWWLSFEEKIVGHTLVIQCVDQGESFKCDSDFMTQKTAEQVGYLAGRIRWRGNVLIGGSFRYPVILQQQQSADDPNVQAAGLGSVILALPRPGTQRDCTLSPAASNHNKWWYSCILAYPDQQPSGSFAFENEKDKMKFSNLIKIVESLNKESRLPRLLLMVVAFVVPLLIFLLLSLGVFLLLKVMRFIVGR